MWEMTEWSERTEPPLETRNAVSRQLTGRILIVDDDPHFLRVLSRILTGERFHVSTAIGVREAVELLQETAFDVIICDLRMPERDGLCFLREIRAAGSKVPVIILTAYGEVDTYLEAMNAGASEYLSKPIGSEELLRAVRGCIQTHRAQPAG